MFAASSKRVIIIYVQTRSTLPVGYCERRACDARPVVLRSRPRLAVTSERRGERIAWQAANGNLSQRPTPPPTSSQQSSSIRCLVYSSKGSTGSKSRQLDKGDKQLKFIRQKCRLILHPKHDSQMLLISCCCFQDGKYSAYRGVILCYCSLAQRLSLLSLFCSYRALISQMELKSCL